MPVTPVFRLLRTLLVGGVAVLAGCSTTGNSFNTADLRYLQTGYTTLPEASEFLQGDPVNVYRQSDGSAIARWAHTNTVLTDAIYFKQELWLAFDPGGYFQRVVKSHNIPSSNLYHDGQRVDSLQPSQAGNASMVHVSVPEEPTQPSLSVQPQEQVVETQQPLAASPEPVAPASPFSRTAVSYPLSR